MSITLLSSSLCVYSCATLSSSVTGNITTVISEDCMYVANFGLCVFVKNTKCKFLLVGLLDVQSDTDVEMKRCTVYEITSLALQKVDMDIL